ncbi:hypothetical protein CJU90_1375 [Yarrowia sp. C11]|nr:hypothetical protein CKK34_0100 [Yarrowia sp. E02]KAG5371361.1 hypothetical protein CJU90_1375 [Yarrowia sp. C11]
MSAPIPQQLLQQPPPMLRNPHLESQRVPQTSQIPQTPQQSSGAPHDPPQQATDFWLLSGNLAANALYCAAFPLLTGLYAARGLSEEPLKPAKWETKLLKFFNTDVEKLNECYSPLVALGFPYFAVYSNSMGILSILWSNWVGLIQIGDDQHMLSLLQGAEQTTKGFSWLAGLLSLGTLGIWTYRRQQRRSEQAPGKSRLWLIGAPEVSLAFVSLIFYPLVSTPIYCV